MIKFILFIVLTHKLMVSWIRKQNPISHVERWGFFIVFSAA